MVSPAKDVTCRKCQKKGHFAAMCLTALDRFYLDTIQDTQDTNFWTTDINVNNVTITFKVDTGAEVTAISKDTLRVLGSPEVTKPSKKLCGPNGQPLSIIGSLTVTMSQKQHTCQQDIFMVKHLKHNLLGLPAIKALNVEACYQTAFSQLVHRIGHTPRRL